MIDLTDVFGDPRLPARFWKKVSEQPNGCWQSSAAVSDRGYAKIVYEQKLWYAHRLVWTLLVGQIPPKFDVDHLCHNSAKTWCTDPDTCLHRRCVRLSHLEAVPHRSNMLRGNGLASLNAVKTHCLHGHRFTKETMYIRPDTGARGCRVCRTAQVLDFLAKNKKQ